MPTDDEKTVNNIINQVVGYVDNLIDDIYDYIGNSISRIAESIGGIFNSVVTVIDNVITKSSELFTALIESISGAMEYLLNDINAIVLAFISRIETAVDELLFSASEYVKNLIDSVAAYIENFINSATTTLSLLYNYVTAKISSTFTTVESFIERTYDKTLTYVKNIYDSASNYISKTYNTVTSKIELAVNGASEFIDSAIDNVSSITTGSIDNISEWIAETYSTLTDDINIIIDSVVNGFSDLYNTIDNAVALTMQNADKLVNYIESSTTRFVDEVVDTIGSSIYDLTDMAAAIPGKIADLAAQLEQSAIDNIAGPIRELPDETARSFLRIIIGSAADTPDYVDKILQGITDNNTGGEFDLQRFIGGFNSAIPDSPLVKYAIGALVLPLTIISVMQGVNSVQATQLMHQYNKLNPSTLLGVPDIVDAYKRDFIDSNKFTDTLKQHGVYPDDIDIYRKLGSQNLPVTDSILMWLRGLMDDGQIDSVLSHHGFEPGDISLLKQAAYYIPGPQDLITMAVREVFSPDVAERFGQFEDYPPEFTQYAGMQGVSEEWARRYWAAHWSLPSPQMGFEMLHRGVINDADLTLLLKSLDVMPFWRDKLQQISYSPLTRVDVRRMHAMGILTRDQVKRSYLDLGYNETNAEYMTQFTEQYNEEPVVDDEPELKTLTRSNVLSFYGDGIIDRDTAAIMLREQGYGDNAVELYLMSVDFDIERDDRKQQRETVELQYTLGQITFEQATDKLNSIGLTQDEILKSFNRIERERAGNIKLPTKTELGEMVMNNIISPDEYKQTMKTLGYSEFWIDRYIALLQVS